MFAGFASTTPTDTHSVYRTYHFVIGAEHILSKAAQGHSTIRLLSYHSVIGTVLVPLSSTTPTFTACSTIVCDALPCGRLYSYIRLLHRSNQHAASIPHARYTQTAVQPTGRIIIHLHNHTAHTSMLDVQELRNRILDML